MIKIGILGDIGSGKSYIAKIFGYPVFNADDEVAKLYKKDKRIFRKLKKVLPKYIYSFPISKNEISKAVLANKTNLKKIVILDIPLLLENKINKKDDILIFIKSERSEVIKRLKKRKNFNQELLKKFRTLQLSLDYKMKKSQFIIKNNFKKNSVKKDVKLILKKLL